ncbi:MAG: ABC transporter substrate-binding protein [Deltaproteobacteria bacterium]|nr:ABC transporter substrate-binding protein [Deltaproteobacteria bacterium]
MSVGKRIFSTVVLVLAFTFSLVSIGTTKNIIKVFMWEIKDWDPHVCYSDGARILTNIYETLVRYEDGKVTPSLATSWEKSDNGRVWTFKLRKGVKFQNGEPFNAYAVKYSIDRLLKMGKGGAWNFEPIKETRAIDEYTVQFVCDEAQPVDLMMTSYYGPYIMPPKLTEAKGSEWFQRGNACGTGPYKLKSYEKGVGAVLEKFDDYWGGWKPDQFDIAIYKIINESSTAVQLLKRGEMDIIEMVPMEVQESLAKEPGIEMAVFESTQNLWYHLHNQKFPTDDINVRKAISHAINVDEMIETIFGKRNAVKAVGPIPYSLWGHDPTLRTYDYNPEKAKQYLAKSRYADQWKKGELKLTITSYDETRLAPATYIQAALKKIGITAEIDSTPWPACWETFKNKERCPQMTCLDWWAEWPTPRTFLTGPWFKEEETLFNWAYYYNPEFERLVNEAMTYEATDISKASEYYSKA